MEKEFNCFEKVKTDVNEEKKKQSSSKRSLPIE